MNVVYLPLDNITVTTDADQDIWELSSPSDRILKLLGWELTSAETTPEACRLRLIRRTTSGNGSAITEENRDPNGPTIAVVGEQLATTPGTGGNILQGWQWEQQGPVGMVYIPEMRPKIDVSSFLCLNLNSALGGSRVWSGWVAVGEE